jgi:hypothetical protein
LNGTIELRIEIGDDGVDYHVDMVRRSSPHAPESFHTASNVVIDPAVLEPFRRDARRYGAALAKQLFEPAALQQGFIAALTAAEQEGARLSVSLVLDTASSRLSAIRWEALTDPRQPDPTLLFVGGARTFSRLIQAQAARGFRPAARDKLRVIVAVASPAGLTGGDGLAPFDAEAERAQIRAIFSRASIGVREIGDACTFDKLQRGLRGGCDVLYLVAHGALQDGVPLLALQKEDGTADFVDARASLVSAVAAMDSPPALAVLASCESGGNDRDGDAFLALGPLLAAEGNVPAVVAMRGTVSMRTAAQFTNAFFVELLLSGRIAQAVDHARRAVADAGDWWMPALFTRAADPVAFDFAGDDSAFGEEVAMNCRATIADAIQRSGFADDRFYVRRDLEGRFEEFLDSSKSAMVIVGQSGMGKTTLVVRLVQRYASQAGHLCFFISSEQLPGELAAVERTIVEQLTASGVEPAEFWKRIDRYCRLREKKLQIFIDAVNEYNRASGPFPPTAIDFLAKLDGMASRARAQYPSIRYVITSRPETWRKGVENNRVRVRNSEGAYFLSNVGAVPEVAHLLSTFSEREAEEAYRKYCDRDNYDIATSRNALSGLTRHLLRDPLLLALTCEVYKHGSIPAELEIGDVFRQYRERLLDTIPSAGFVIDGIISEMFAAGSVVIERDAVVRDTALGDRNSTLYDELNVARPDSTAAALVERNVLRRGAQIRFTYDRFLEYLVSERLLAQIRSSGSREDATEAAVTTIHANLAGAQKLNTVFGALRRTLVRLQAEDVEYARVVERLASDERGLSLVVSVLGRIARTPIGAQPDGLTVLTSVLYAVRESIEVAIRNQQPRPGFPIIDAVYRLLLDAEYRAWLHDRSAERRQQHLEVLYEFFLWGMCHADDAISSAAKQYLYFLWQHEEAYVDAASITETTIERITPIGIGSLTNAEWRTKLFNLTSLFLLTLAEVRGEASSPRLLDCGRKFVQRLGLRQLKVKLGLRLLASTLARWGLDHILTDAPYLIARQSLETLITRDSLRADFAAALNLVEDDRPWNDTVRDDFLRLALIENSYVMLAITFAISKRYECATNEAERIAVLDLADAIFATGSTTAEYSSSLALYEINYFGTQATPESMRRFERMTIAILRQRKGHFLQDGKERSYNVIGTYGRARVRNQALFGADPDERVRNRPLQFAVDALEEAKQRRDFDYYSNICTDIGLLGLLIEPEDVFAVVNCILIDLGRVASAGGSGSLPFDASERAAIETAILQSLANIRVLYTEETDRFLLDGIDDPALYAEVVRRTPKFELKVFLSWTFEQLLFGILTRNYEALGREMMDSIRTGLSGNTAEQFVVTIIRRMLVRLVSLAAE